MIYQKIANVQKAVTNVKKDADNPFFKSKYATYEGVMETIRPHLEKEKLLVIHGFDMVSRDGVIAVSTKIIDLEDEKQVVSTLEIPTVKNDPQAAGSAITYAKRYMVLAMFGLGTEDDDGESAMKRPQTNAIDTELTSNCPVHGDPMVQKMSKLGKPYWSHRMPNGDLCFGK